MDTILHIIILYIGIGCGSMIACLSHPDERADFAEATIAWQLFYVVTSILGWPWVAWDNYRNNPNSDMD